MSLKQTGGAMRGVAGPRCTGTHHLGCDCHEARQNAVIEDLRDGCDMRDATIATLRAELAEARERETHLIACACNPHQHEEGVCERCGGVGSFMYGNTSTWRNGVGGSMMTVGVCNKCWGSGSQEKPWPSWRSIEGDRRNAELLSERFEIASREVDRLKSENATLQREAAKVHRCYEHGGKTRGPCAWCDADRNQAAVDAVRELAETLKLPRAKAYANVRASLLAILDGGAK